MPLYPAARPTRWSRTPRSAVVGYAVTANFFPRYKVARVTARLADAGGHEVPCWLSTPEKPLPGAGSYTQILPLPKARLARRRRTRRR
ncbi:MAG: hypothetical protein U0797_20435 [Gemmataceae bacterium]